MNTDGQVQAVPRAIMEEKLDKKLSLGDTFTTKTGIWKIVDTDVDESNGSDILIVEKIT